MHDVAFEFARAVVRSKDAQKKISTNVLNYKSVAKEISKPPFLAPEVQWASKFTVFVWFTFLLNVWNHTHIWYVTWPQ